MVRPRVIETTQGIQDKLTVEVFNEFAKTMWDKGWNNVDLKISWGKRSLIIISPWLKRPLCTKPA